MASAVKRKMGRCKCTTLVALHGNARMEELVASLFVSHELHCEEHNVNGDTPDELLFGGRWTER